MKAMSLPDGRFCFNLSGAVGRGQPNYTEDVHFVQFGFACSAINVGTTDTPADKKIFAAVKPGAPFTGLPDDPLCLAIARMQQKYGGTQDGIVSVLPNTASPFKYNRRTPHLRTMLYLLMDIYDTNADLWPMLDGNTVCPQLVKEAVRKIFKFKEI